MIETQSIIINMKGGEKLKKKILGIFGCLLVSAMLTIPVMASPATRIEGVTASIETVTANDWRIVDHDIWQLFDGTASGEVTISIPEKPDLTGIYEGEWHGKIKSGPMAGMMQWPEAECHYNSRMVWTFAGEGTTGTFEGTRHAKAIGFPPTVCSYIEIKMVLYGTGDFQGQILELSYEGALPSVLEGSLLIPN
jgi:hypothetical protein